MIGVDLGGTNVRAMAIYADGSPAGPYVDRPSRAQEGVDATLRATAEAIASAAGASADPPVAVGLAIPGHVDNHTGFVRWAPNFGSTRDGVFRYWRDVAVRAPLQQLTQLPIAMGNDANVAALGEYRYGVGKNESRSFVLFTLGTGVGCGIVLSPNAVHGEAKGPLILIGGNGGGAEVGHMVVRDGGHLSSAGTYGSVEAYCSAGPIAERARAKLLRGRSSSILDFVGGDLAQITPKEIAHAALDCDEVAIEVWDEVGQVLGVAIGNVINIFAPDIVAVGGQISKAGEWLMRPARRAARTVAIPSLFDDCAITLAAQSQSAGILGAAALALEAVEREGITS